MAQQNDDVKPVAELNYEEARDELVETVRCLEQGGLSLDDSLALWERGEELGQRCEAVSYTHLTLPTIALLCRSRWWPDH